MENKNLNIASVTDEIWQLAQKAELKCWINEGLDGDDWNSWWASKFLNYSFLAREKNIESIYEVGCGPYAKNIEMVCATLGYTPKRLLLEDPLLSEYISLNKSVKRFTGHSNVKIFSKPMERFNLSDENVEQVDILICNNVLDHVQSIEGCFEHVHSSLRENGIFIFGQDLTSADDVLKHSDLVDPCHPIRIDQAALELYLQKYDVIYKNVLSREEGRNPEHHYATMIFAGRKKPI